MDVGLCILQVEAQMLGQCLYSRLRRIVRCIAWGICNALFAARDYDSAWRVGRARLERWDVCVQSVDYAKEVCVEDLSRGLGMTPHNLTTLKLTYLVEVLALAPTSPDHSSSI